MVAARHLTREEQVILRGAMRDCVEIINEEYPGEIGKGPRNGPENVSPCNSDTGLQNGMLAYYLAQAVHADANVEARIDKEPSFDYRKSLIDQRSPIYPGEWLEEK